MMAVCRTGRLARMMAAERRAQATVEMAIVVPVMLVLGLIVYNLMMFAAATARFDRMAPDIVLAHGVAPASDWTGAADGSDAVAVQLEQAMEGYAIEVEVSCESGSHQGDGSILGLVGASWTYRCVMRYRPWPGGLSVAGVSLGAPDVLVHERSVTVDPWKPGVIV